MNILFVIDRKTNIINKVICNNNNNNNNNINGLWLL